MTSRIWSSAAFRIGFQVCVSAFATALSLATLYIALHKGFGSGDLPAFALWCVWFGVFLASIAPALLARLVRRGRPRAILFSIAIGLVAGVIFTFVVALALGGWIGAFSFPILYIWALAGAIALGTGAGVASNREAALTARVPSARRAAVLGVSVLLLAGALPIVLMFGATTIWDRGEHEIHLIPDGFEGPVVIVFGDSSGAPELREHGSRLYRIPPSGILRSRFKQNEGWTSSEFFYEDAHGKRRRLDSATPCSDSVSAQTVQACDAGQMMLSNETGRYYQGYTVGRREVQRALSEREDSLVRAVVFGDSGLRKR